MPFRTLGDDCWPRALRPVPVSFALSRESNRPGDWWCPRCEWLLAAEMLQGEDPIWLDETLRCPMHRDAS